MNDDQFAPFLKAESMSISEKKIDTVRIKFGVSKFLLKFGGEFWSTQRPTQNVRKQVRVTETKFRFMNPTFMTSNFPPTFKWSQQDRVNPKETNLSDSTKTTTPFPPSPSAVQLSKGACHRGDQQIIATLSNDLNPSIWAPTTVYGENL